MRTKVRAHVRPGKTKANKRKPISESQGRKIMHRINRHLVSAAVLASACTAGAAAAGSLGGPLELQDEASFFIGGHSVHSEHPGTPNTGGAGPGQIMINQMYVQYRIPRTVSGPPIVMVHGSGHTGVTYETTP